MSMTAINESLQELISIHEELLHIFKRKTNIVKEGSLEKFQALLLEEQKYIKIVEKAEEKRQQAVEKWYKDRNLPPNKATITNMLDILTDETAQQQLEQLTIQLTNSITRLKEQEQLNQALIKQSMQFVQLSLDMLNPTIKNINYGKQQGTTAGKRSAFDSQA